MVNIKDFKKKLSTKGDVIFEPNYNDTSHDLLKYLLVKCQIIGLFPMHNICCKDPSNIKFNWLSWKIVYTITICAVSTICSYLGFFCAFQIYPVITHLVLPMVFMQVAVTTLISINVSKNWHKFITSITYLEMEINKKYGASKNLRSLLNILTLAVYAIGTIEHLMEIISITFKTGSRGFIIHIQQKCVYLYGECNYCWSVVYVVFCIISWAVCVTVDVFIINLSVIFAYRFKQIADSFNRYNDVLQIQEISSVYLTDKTSKYYQEIREDYSKLALAVHQVDKLFGNLIICSYIFNISLILIQLFNSLRYINSHLYSIHFFYSFGFIIMRLVLVTIYGSSVNEESKKFAAIIPKVPDDHWSEDLQRIMAHIYYDSIALTGGQFFKITRRLTLNIAASIISYELILIQFNQSALKDFVKPINNSNSTEYIT